MCGGGRGARKSLAERAVIPRPRPGSPKFVDGGRIENSRAIAHVCRLSVATRRDFSVVCLTCFHFSFFFFSFLLYIIKLWQHHFLRVDFERVRFSPLHRK